MNRRTFFAAVAAAAVVPTMKPAVKVVDFKDFQWVFVKSYRYDKATRRLYATIKELEHKTLAAGRRRRVLCQR